MKKSKKKSDRSGATSSVKHKGFVIAGRRRLPTLMEQTIDSITMDGFDFTKEMERTHGMLWWFKTGEQYRRVYRNWGIPESNNKSTVTPENYVEQEMRIEVDKAIMGYYNFWYLFTHGKSFYKTYRNWGAQEVSVVS